jgi:hypothetical protein
LRYLLLVLFFISSHCQAFDVVIPIEKMQKKIEQKFPVEKDKKYYWAKMSNPLVLLDSQTNRLGLALDLSFRLFEKVKRHGHVKLLGTPRFDSKQCEFYLADTAVESLQLNDARPDQQYYIRQLLNKLAKKKLQHLTLHQIDDCTAKKQLLNVSVQSIQVQESAVVISLLAPVPSH